jgi:hypothetical protein
MLTPEFFNKSVEERYQWLKEKLATGVFEVTFTKVDGSVRNMPCTLKEDLFPPPTGNQKEPRTQETLSVWCTDKSEWRSFKVMNVTAVTEKTESETTWIVTCEEDPETGDLIMPLPQGLLESQGWADGDTLVWGVDEADGTVTLKKKVDDVQNVSTE